MRRIVAKIISIAGILFVAFMVFAFFFWYYYEATDWSASKEILEIIQPFVDLMQPSMDFYSNVYDWFCGLFES